MKKYLESILLKYYINDLSHFKFINFELSFVISDSEMREFVIRTISTGDETDHESNLYYIISIGDYG